MRKTICAGILVLIAGCGTSSSTDLQPSVCVTEADNGKEVTLKKGQAIQIKLQGDGAPDHFWGCKKAPPTVEFLTEGKEGNLFEFNFKIKDSGPVTLEYVMFNETGVVKKKDFTINIKAID
jgi:predicted secreted protein